MGFKFPELKMQIESTFMELCKLFQEYLPERLARPRTEGLTMVIDRKLGPQSTKDFLELNSRHIDLWKFGYGTSVVTPKEILIQKINAIKSHNILAFPGGTLFEFAFYWNEVIKYLDTIKHLGFNAVEISDGTVEVDKSLRKFAIKEAIERGFVVLSEVGNKDPKNQPSAEKIVDEILEDFHSGSGFVIVEGRESGKSVGVFDDNGLIKEHLLEALIKKLPQELAKRVIWEAPRTDQQIFFIKKFGSNINLGNIHPEDVLGLETLRRGLRWDTFQRKK